jgi:hypothetical protein
MQGLANVLIILTLVAFISCKKEPVVFDGNDAPNYAGVSTVVLNNYVNRLFIDLLGREPLNSEMADEVKRLRDAELSAASRGVLVDKLMFNTDFIEGDSSYRRAYCVKVYENLKARFIEGSSDGFLTGEYNFYRSTAVLDSLNGDLTSYALKMQEAARLEALLQSRAQWQSGLIDIDEMVRRMLFNAVYDEINMNAFNFVNASFDDLFYRFPTNPEFENAYTIVEFNEPALIFNRVAQNKSEYLDVLTTTGEFFEGMTIWVYRSLLSRAPSSQETFTSASPFSEDLNLSAIQRRILISDEYAGFN